MIIYISGWELIDFVSHDRSKPKLVTSLSLIIPQRVLATFIVVILTRKCDDLLITIVAF